MQSCRLRACSTEMSPERMRCLMAAGMRWSPNIFQSERHSIAGDVVVSARVMLESTVGATDLGVVLRLRETRFPGGKNSDVAARMTFTFFARYERARIGSVAAELCQL